MWWISSELKKETKRLEAIQKYYELIQRRSLPEFYHAGKWGKIMVEDNGDVWIFHERWDGHKFVVDNDLILVEKNRKEN
jgi:hypothetical protein